MSPVQLPILYSFRRCPYAIRTRMSLAYAGINFEVREVRLNAKPPSLLEVSPKATVPVILIGDRVLEESLDIMNWALAQADPEGWLDYDAATAERVQLLVNDCERKFKPVLDRYKYADRHPEQSQIQHRRNAEVFIDQLEAQLTHQHASGANYLFGSKPGYADVAIFPFVRQFAYVDIDCFRHSPYAALQQWLDHFLDSELFQVVMKKYPVWQEGDAPVCFRSVQTSIESNPRGD